MRHRYVHRIGRGDVGSRVSIRRWVDDGEGGRRPSDVVGRLTGWSDDDVLTVVDRDGRPTRIDVGDVLASRTVPEHPRLPPEPDAPDTGPGPAGGAAPRG